MIKFKTKPKPYQKSGALFLLKRKRALLGYKTGLGKTFSTLIAMQYYLDKGLCKSFIVVCPKNASNYVWSDEIVKHTNLTYEYALNLIDVYENKISCNLFKTNIIIMRYSEIVKFSNIKKGSSNFLSVLLSDNPIVLDEAHRIRNPKTQMAKAFTKSAVSCSIKWGLTATAVLNEPLDLWGLFEFFDPTVFGTRNKFFFDYITTVTKKVWRRNKKTGRRFQAKYPEITGYRNLDKLRDIRKRYIKVLGIDIEVKFSNIQYKMSKEDEDIYYLAAKGILSETKDVKQFSARLPDLQRVVDGSSTEKAKNIVDRANNKYCVYRDIVKKILKDNQSCIVYCDYYFTFDMLNNLFSKDFPDTPIFNISGKGVSLPDKFPCIVICTAGGSESLNLKFANHVLFYSVPFSVGVFIQMVGRITRIDSEYLDNLNIYLPYNELNIDYYKYQYLMLHSQVINQLLGDEGNLPKSVVDVRKEKIIEMRDKLLWRKN